MDLIPCYINLNSRSDRRKETEGEFEKLNIKDYVRFSAIYNSSNGAIGCLQSHIAILESYNIDSDVIWICEDDMQFLVDRPELDRYIKEFLDSSGDILCLGFNSRQATQYSDLLLRTTDTQTTSTYIIKSKFRKVLLDYWKSVLSSILNNEEHPAKTVYNSLNIWKGAFEAADQCWKVLQQDHIFLIPNKKLLIQRAGYSDIEHRCVNYNT
jgi:GR25 family glycosyltransferase involved in LPS biosynthesis